MLRRGAGRLLTGRVAFFVAGLLDAGVVARLLIVHLWRVRGRMGKRVRGRMGKRVRGRPQAPPGG